MQLRVFLQLAVILVPTCELLAQGFVDNALLFSRTRPGGSARIQALGGAQIALGGDFSSALSNPAGLGMYNRSEFTFSPALNFYNTDTHHFGTSENDSNSKLTIPGISYIHHSAQNKGGFKGGSFGISMTRTNDFNNVFRYSGDDRFSSMIDWFIEDANGIHYENLNYDFSTGLAFDSYLIDTLSGYTDRYFSALFLGENPDDLILTRIGTIKSKGSQYQWSLAYGANLNDKFFFGANIGITTLRYKFKSTYSESDFNFFQDPNFEDILTYFDLEETIDIEGTGVNLALGAIFRPFDFLQVGASFVTPTFYQFTDTYSARLKTQWNNYNYLDRDPPNPEDPLNYKDFQSNQALISEYTLTTPLKLSVGAAFFIANYGFISGDLEFVNYKKAKYDSDIGGISFNPENDAIDYLFRNTVNYRIGGEFRYEALRLRVGYNVQGNPINPEFDVDRGISTFSAGVGFRMQKFFADLAWLNTMADTSYSPYVFQDGYGPIVDLNNKINTFILTFGLNF
jgi:hypothetical protein